MRLTGWGALWGLGLFLVPFTAISAVGVLFNPASIGYLVFALPVVAVAGATTGALGGGLASVTALILRNDRPSRRTLTRRAIVYLVVMTIAVTALFLLFVPADARPGQAPAIPVVVLSATGLATWGFARDRRRAMRAESTWTPHAAGRG